VLAADLGDRDGGKVLLLPLKGSLPRLQVIWADSGYNGAPFEQWVKEHLGVRLEIAKHPWTGQGAVWVKEGEVIDWDKIMPKGFHILPRRWVVERTNAWITHCRRLSRDYEGTYSSSESFIGPSEKSVFLAIRSPMYTRTTNRKKVCLAFLVQTRNTLFSDSGCYCTGLFRGATS
jgi:transposase